MAKTDVNAKQLVAAAKKRAALKSAEKAAKKAKVPSTTLTVKPEEVLPLSEGDVIGNLISREIETTNGELEPLSETVYVLQSLIKTLSSGSDISSAKASIMRISANQPEKAELFQAVLNLINQERVAEAVFLRAQVEKALNQSVRRGKLTTTECLAVWNLANDTIKEYEARADKANKAVDSLTVFEKVDLKTLEAERMTQRRWANTTPQGRQIIRMKLFDLKRQIAAEQAGSSNKAAPAQEVVDVEDSTVTDK